MVEGLSAAGVLKRRQLRLVARQDGADIQLVRGQDVSAPVAPLHVRPTEEARQRLRHSLRRYDVHVEE